MCRRTTIGMLAVSALAVSACGASSQGATTPRPPAPVNLTVYIDDHRVSLSPSSVGAGPVAFIITNQADSAESLAILPKGSAAGRPLADTGPINPQATAQVTVNFSSPGTYSVSTGRGDGGPASSVQAATLTVGKARGNSNNQLLQP
ncbi:MAG TPA: hypothetical protein VJU80_08570 [Solirubrobacteraceae bacterium]|nr:hypothetical protein [Solirubrobacteraceae bacterium]